jgi:hypothetical protein
MKNDELLLRAVMLYMDTRDVQECDRLFGVKRTLLLESVRNYSLYGCVRAPKAELLDEEMVLRGPGSLTLKSEGVAVLLELLGEDCTTPIRILREMLAIREIYASEAVIIKVLTARGFTVKKVRSVLSVPSPIEAR